MLSVTLKKVPLFKIIPCQIPYPLNKKMPPPANILSSYLLLNAIWKIPDKEPSLLKFGYSELNFSIKSHEIKKYMT